MEDPGNPLETSLEACLKLLMKCALARLRLVRAHLCTDLYENLVGGGLLSYEHKFQIS